MKLIKLRLSNFQCFGPAPTEIHLDPLTFLIGANGMRSGMLVEVAIPLLCAFLQIDASSVHDQVFRSGLDTTLRMVSEGLSR